MPDGVYTVSVTAVDTAANSAVYNRSFTLDGLAPAKPGITGGDVTTGTLQVRPLENRSNVAEVTLSGTREDDSGVWINGAETVPIGSGDWSVDLTLNQGEEYIQISGIVRPQDVGTNNTILSTQIGDARITYSGEGVLAESNKMGWLARFFNHPVWPF